MRNSDLTVRIAAGVELVAILFNMFMAFLYFISLIWVLVGVLWALVGLGALLQAGLAVFVLVKGYTPVALVAPVLGLCISLCNFNIFGFMLEALVLILMIVALVLRGQEDAAANAG